MWLVAITGHKALMMHVVKFKPEWREVFPAVTHVDGAGRLQSVDAENNALYYKLIAAVKARTGHGIVLNTSFNENEPVVDTPRTGHRLFRPDGYGCAGAWAVCAHQTANGHRTKPGLMLCRFT